jgi:hypothetical protein
MPNPANLIEGGKNLCKDCNTYARQNGLYASVLSCSNYGSDFRSFLKTLACEKIIEGIGGR